MYKIFALIGEAGSGKDYLLGKILESFPDRFNEIISCTTRPPREREKDGKNYYFLSPEEFAAQVYDGQMLESTSFNGWNYGTSLADLTWSTPNIGVFNIAGIQQLLKNKDIELFVFRVVCDDKTRLLRQLNREQNPDIQEIVRRFSTDEADFKKINFNHYVLYNNNTEEAAQAISDFINIAFPPVASKVKKD